MNLKSMTGFGRSEGEIDGRIYAIELRCVNNRYLDLKMKLPRGYVALEERIRKEVTAYHLRGRVDLLLTLQGEKSRGRKVRINSDIAQGYMTAFKELAAQFALKEEISLHQLASFPDVITQEEQEESLDDLWKEISPILDEALRNCEEMRRAEGTSLAEDLRMRLQQFSQTVDAIEQRIPELVAQRQAAMQERVDKLLEPETLDSARLAQEIALIADKTDVTEEIVRLRSHIDQFQRFLEADGAIGRKLDFLVQEFLREVNTIASKINDADIAHHTVELKSELEKMREQVQNIE
ncbi:YicC family protein [candidate division KSB3 bacterium]|uniref:YicC family protein n=1 Tax=candidate division KSB3 bacterium TaxID=2044937 RepID=A0A2G6E0S6_9BACT|nr:MAG: YicC family protein [candidate division KSB3 bacterium]